MWVKTTENKNATKDSWGVWLKGEKHLTRNVCISHLIVGTDRLIKRGPVLFLTQEEKGHFWDPFYTGFYTSHKDFTATSRFFFFFNLKTQNKPYNDIEFIDFNVR